MLDSHFALRAAPLAFVLVLTGCPSMKPPPSQMPSAQAAIDRLRATGACGTGLQAAAKIDHFGEKGRVRGDLLMFASIPARIRMDIVSPFGVTVATLASDGREFSLADLREKRFFIGPASACNIARLTTVPIPGSVLVELLRGQPPVLIHPESAKRRANSAAASVSNPARVCSMARMPTSVLRARSGT